jgi:hypothetical protein
VRTPRAHRDTVDQAEGEPAVTMTRSQRQSGCRVLALRDDDHFIEPDERLRIAMARQ